MSNMDDRISELGFEITEESLSDNCSVTSNITYIGVDFRSIDNLIFDKQDFCMAGKYLEYMDNNSNPHKFILIDNLDDSDNTDTWVNRTIMITQNQLNKIGLSSNSNVTAKIYFKLKSSEDNIWYVSTDDIVNSTTKDKLSKVMGYTKQVFKLGDNKVKTVFTFELEAHKYEITFMEDVYPNDSWYNIKISE